MVVSNIWKRYIFVEWPIPNDRHCINNDTRVQRRTGWLTEIFSRLYFSFHFQSFHKTRKILIIRYIKDGSGGKSYTLMISNEICYIHIVILSSHITVTRLLQVSREQWHAFYPCSWTVVCFSWFLYLFCSLSVCEVVFCCCCCCFCFFCCCCFLFVCVFFF